MQRLASCLAFTLVLHTLRAASPDFTVESPTDGKKFTLSEAKGKHVALHFLLKTECPFCLKHTHEYAMKSTEMPDVIHVFLKPDTAEEIKAWAAKIEGYPNPSQPTIYRDENAKLADAYNIPNGYQFHGQTVHFPALVVLNRMGREVFRYVGKNNSDRFSYERFKEKIAELNGKPAAAIQQYNLGTDGLALAGYDPVTYFSKNQAVKGRKEISLRSGGALYLFSSEDNKAAFAKSPGEYLPTYGGWCATAMAKGEKVEIDPTNFKVSNGRLFLFFKAFYANAIKEWNKDETNLAAKADANWKKISGE